MIEDIELLYLLKKVEQSLPNTEFKDSLEVVKYLLNQYIAFEDRKESLKTLIEEFRYNNYF